MQGSAWINLLQRIPSSHHDAIALGLVTGAEVVVQQMIRMEQDFVIIKGRMSGSTAEGRIMMVPYSHLTLVAFSRLMTEPEVQEIFGQQAPAAAAPAPAAPAAPAAKSAAPAAKPAAHHAAAAPTPPAPASNPATAAAHKPGAAEGLKPPPSKSVLLARLRQRLAEKAK